MDHYILPDIGQISLARLTHMHIENLYRKRSDTLEPTTVHRIHRVLRTCLNRAVKWAYLDRSPMERVDSPENRSKQRNTITVSDARRMLEWLYPRRPVAYMACFLALYTGMRSGEVAGLKWKDVDFESQVLSVDRTRQRMNREDVLGPTKTDGSQRRIVVAPIVVETLRRWKMEQETFNRDWNDELFVVSLIDGTTQAPDTFVKGVQAARKALGIPNMTFHDLRHTHATWLLESGVDLKVVSQRLGHSTITLTADTYAHVTDSMQRNAVEKLNTMMEKQDMKK